jgi:uncharacterized repeat protein (TIGR04076 family)
MSKENQNTDIFHLYDLKLVVESIDGNCTCDMCVDDYVLLKGGKISIDGQKNFCLYALQSAIPLLPAKQRLCHPADWMETDTKVVCPDPECKLTMRIERLNKRSFKHNEVSAIPIDEN